MTRKFVGVEKIEHLIFEGGGGKGLVYLGALDALYNDVKLLPLTPGGQVKGVAGGSAGAMTAFLLALGLEFEEVKSILNDADTFEGFYDGPAPNKIRAVTNDEYHVGEPVEFPLASASIGRPRRIPNRPIPGPRRADRLQIVRQFPWSLLGPSAEALLGAGGIAAAIGGVYGSQVADNDRLSDLLAFIGGAGTALVPLMSLVQGAVSPASIRQMLIDLVAEGEFEDVAPNPKGYLRPLVGAITVSPRAFEDYIYNLLFDRGLFPGFAVRTFLEKHLAAFLERQRTAVGLGAQDPSRMCMKDFVKATEIDVRISGVNLTTGRPQMFSASLTPSFPILDAVCLSSAFPFAFKPVLVTGCANVDDGYYADGGILNNLPLHIFDHPQRAGLNESVLAIRLVEPRSIEASDYDEYIRQVNQHLADLDSTPERRLLIRQQMIDSYLSIVKPQAEHPVVELASTLATHANSIKNTLMYPMEAGQVRRPVERGHIIELNTGKINTLQFAFKKGSAEARELAILQGTAREKIIQELSDGFPLPL